ncbi:hypothetical protein GO003_014730 [Methylicorpusculum oleiharenae]|uniref:hypothetical protein n=1 Tax=Methylicorpusculum oleiharenae TaxID=1338687 RepID=UPI00135ADAB1|nr:hypothetical protein [Methylicorpusculum oleiharenae]MCD2451648.1 hypothetical protein [Methylicorpusculum oleiharenae]
MARQPDKDYQLKLSIEELKRVLLLKENQFYWLCSYSLIPGLTPAAGRMVDGREVMRIGGKLYSTEALKHFYQCGEWPSGCREAEPEQTQSFYPRSKHRGVCWAYGKWVAKVRISGRMKQLGSFTDENEAARIVQETLEQLRQGSYQAR